MNTTRPATPGAYRKPWPCRIGWHSSFFGDSSRCISVRRCNRCETPEDSFIGRWQDNCRRLVTQGEHPVWFCSAPSSDAPSEVTS